QHVACVHGAFSSACADDIVQLVNEEQNPACCALNLVEDGLEPLLEFAPILRPATSAPRSRAKTVLSRRPSGTSPLLNRYASPSTIAVLPTPGSPISTGLFLVLRDRIWMVRRISESRPITGSSRPAAASATRSRPYFPSASYVPSGVADVTR